MSDGRQVKGGQTLRSKLDLADLKTVHLVQEQHLIMSIYTLLVHIYSRLKQLFIVGWFIAITETIVIWWWGFLHSLPWPQIIVDLIARLDNITVKILDFVIQRIEWWYDVISVRLMWFRESLEMALDRILTIVDKYFAMLQDLILLIFNFITRPISAIFDRMTTYAEETPAVNKTIPSTATPKTNVNNKNGSARRNSEGYDEEDNEDIGEEDYLSDASLDSKRLMKEDAGGQSYMRYRTTGTAEGKFREAMYHRVRNELCLMRQNSIRFSRGLVNYARQMVETKTRKYSESFLEFFQKWARELGILEMLTTMEEEMRGRRFLAKPLVLVRVLIEVLLASLLRQVRGKRSRRTRSMRSESLRRRAQQSLSGMTNPLPLSPAALQQSSEPAQHPQLSVQPALRPTVLKEEERDLDGFLSKDSALGSEDNHSEECESDQTISPNDEGPESDSDMERQRRRSYDSSNSPAFKGSLDRIDENDVSDNGEPSSLENNQIVDANLLNADEHKPNSQSKKGKSSKQKLRFNPQL